MDGRVERRDDQRLPRPHRRAIRDAVIDCDRLRCDTKVGGDGEERLTRGDDVGVDLRPIRADGGMDVVAGLDDGSLGIERQGAPRDLGLGSHECELTEMREIAGAEDDRDRDDDVDDEERRSREREAPSS